MRTDSTNVRSISPPGQPIITQELIDEFVAEVTIEKGWTAEQADRFLTLLPQTSH